MVNSSFSRFLVRLVNLSLLLILAAGCAAAPAAAPAQPTTIPGKLGDVLRRGTLIIATDYDYAPQSELLADVPRLASTRCAANEYTANQVRGSDVDVAVEIARRLGVEPCFVTPPWSQIISGSWNDRWDVSVGSMAITTERMQLLYFTQPYTTGAAVVFVHQDNQPFQKPSDLSGKRIGACAGCAYEYYLKHTLVIPGVNMDYQIKDPIIAGYDTDTSALQDLAKGDGVVLDAVLTDPDTGRIAIEEDGLPIKQLGEPVYRDYVAAAVDKKSSSDPLPLVIRISQIIQEMHQDGFLNQLMQRVYHGDFASPAASYDLNALGQYQMPR